MKKINFLTPLLISISFTGCGISWVNLDNSIPNENKIKEASQKCKVDDRIYAINQDQNARSYVVSLSGAEGKAKEQLIKVNKEKEQKDYQVIYDCMEKEGLKKQN